MLLKVRLPNGCQLALKSGDSWRANRLPSFEPTRVLAVLPMYTVKRVV